MAYNEVLRQWRIAYIDSAIAEMNALANLIENDDPSKFQLLNERAQELGLVAQREWQGFIEVAKSYHPDNPIFDTSLIEASGDEN
jgi:hypothetical protein